MIDWTKPIQTKDGRKARVICTDRKVATSFDGTHIILVVDYGVELIYTYNSEGELKPGLGFTGDLDLINVPTKKWLNIYRYDNTHYKPGYILFSSILFETKEGAEAAGVLGSFKCFKTIEVDIEA